MKNPVPARHAFKDGAPTASIYVAASAPQAFQALESLRPLSSAHLPADLRRVVGGFAKAFGALHYAFAVMDRLSADHLVWSCEDTPAWWRELRPEMDAMMDSPGAHPGDSHAAGVPYLWFGTDPVAGGGEDGRCAWLDRFGIRYGVALMVEAIHPGSTAACLALGFGGDRVGPRRDRETLQSLAHHGASLMFDAYLRLPAVAPQGAAKLSSRERECLRWASVGKTSWETACILEVGERTVNFHLGNAFGKLKVNNKQAAVAQALLQGLL